MDYAINWDMVRKIVKNSQNKLKVWMKPSL